MRAAVLVALVAAALPAWAGTAAADVSVAASRASAGARSVLITFRVTDPDPAVPTTRLQVFLPTARPLLGVRPTAPVGWTVRTDVTVPTDPPTLDGEPVTAVVAAVTWAGGTVAGGDTAVFPLDVGRLPDGAGPLRFHVVQTFANGATEEWSDLVPYGAPPPAHPALEIPYSAGPGDAAAVPATPGAHHHHHHHGDEDVALPAGEGGGALWAFLALAGALGTAVGTASGALGRRQERLLAAAHDAHDPPGRGDAGRGGAGAVSPRGRRP